MRFSTPHTNGVFVDAIEVDTGPLTDRTTERRYEQVARDQVVADLGYAGSVRSEMSWIQNSLVFKPSTPSIL